MLERVGLVRQTIAGRQRICRLEAMPLASAFAWLRFYERFLEERLDAPTVFHTPFDTHPMLVVSSGNE